MLGEGRVVRARGVGLVTDDWTAKQFRLDQAMLTGSSGQRFLRARNTIHFVLTGMASARPIAIRFAHYQGDQLKWDRDSRQRDPFERAGRRVDQLRLP